MSRQALFNKDCSSKRDAGGKTRGVAKDFQVPSDMRSAPSPAQ
jgi:hypothetical protein